MNNAIGGPPQDFETRRVRMLDELLVEVTRHQGRRRAARRLALALPLLLAIGSIWLIASQAGSQHPVAPIEPSTAVQVVTGEYRTGLVRLIDDDELVERLAEIERPTGLIRIEGKARLTRAVVDADRGEPGDEPSL